MVHSKSLAPATTNATPLAVQGDPNVVAAWVLIQAKVGNADAVRIFSKDQFTTPATPPTGGGTVLYSGGFLYLTWAGRDAGYNLQDLYITCTNAADGVDLMWNT